MPQLNGTLKAVQSSSKVRCSGLAWLLKGEACLFIVFHLSSDTAQTHDHVSTAYRPQLIEVV